MIWKRKDEKSREERSKDVRRNRIGVRMGMRSVEGM